MRSTSAPLRLLRLLRPLRLLPLVALLSMGCACAQHVANTNCALIVPANPLSAKGLATPYQLVAQDPTQGKCTMVSSVQQAFVEGLILDTSTGEMFVYNPVVVDAGTPPAIQPTVPTLPASYIAALWFGFNGQSLKLIGTTDDTNLLDSLLEGNCVQGVLTGNMADSFMLFAYCNAQNFFQVANSLIKTGKIQVPTLGRASDLLYCPTIRDFSIVSATQSSGVVSSYLLTSTGLVAQNTVANQAAITKNDMSFSVIGNNAGDNWLLVNYILPAVGCSSWLVPDLANNNQPAASLALNELFAQSAQLQPVANVPVNDPLVMTWGLSNIIKLNAYRLGVGQPLLAAITPFEDGDALVYCQAAASGATNRLTTSMTLFKNVRSPAPLITNNLYTFLALRFNQTYAKLGCATLLQRPCPIKLHNNSMGVITDAHITIVSLISPGAYSNNAMCVSVGIATGLGVTLGILILLDLVFVLIYCFGGTEALPAQSYYEYSRKKIIAPESEKSQDILLQPIDHGVA